MNSVHFLLKGHLLLSRDFFENSRNKNFSWSSIPIGKLQKSSTVQWEFGLLDLMFRYSVILPVKCRRLSISRKRVYDHPESCSRTSWKITMSIWISIYLWAITIDVWLVILFFRLKMYSACKIICLTKKSLASFGCAVRNLESNKFDNCWWRHWEVAGTEWNYHRLVKLMWYSTSVKRDNFP